VKAGVKAIMRTTTTTGKLIVKLSAFYGLLQDNEVHELCSREALQSEEKGSPKYTVHKSPCW